MAFHIVTKRCFLACENVTSIIIEELTPLKPKLKRKLVKSKKLKTSKTSTKVPIVEKTPRLFTITISYYPLNQGTMGQNPNNRDPTEYSLELRVVGKKETFALYREILKEVQEQHPSAGYLDKLVGQLLEVEPEEGENNDDW